MKEKHLEINKAKSKEKRIASVEEELKLKNRDISIMKMKSTFIVAAAMIFIFWRLNSAFSGVIVAKLPFHPIPLIQGISHRNINGEDMTDCSVTFIYALCSLSIRSSLQKFLGFESSNSGFGFQNFLNDAQKQKFY
jgi:uncharacterized membrane protein (DUF106 family)